MLDGTTGLNGILNSILGLLNQLLGVLGLVARTEGNTDVPGRRPAGRTSVRHDRPGAANGDEHRVQAGAVVM